MHNAGFTLQFLSQEMKLTNLELALEIGLTKEHSDRSIYFISCGRNYSVKPTYILSALNYFKLTKIYMY